MSDSRAEFEALMRIVVGPRANLRRAGGVYCCLRYEEGWTRWQAARSSPAPSLGTQTPDVSSGSGASGSNTESAVEDCEPYQRERCCHGVRWENRCVNCDARLLLSDEAIDSLMRTIGNAAECYRKHWGLPTHGDWPAFYRAQVRTALAKAAALLELPPAASGNPHEALRPDEKDQGISVSGAPPERGPEAAGGDRA